MDTLTAEFPREPEPERQPDPQLEFNEASGAQQEAEAARLAQLEAERIPQGTVPVLTPGGQVEQEVHSQVWSEREAQIAALEAEMSREDEFQR